MLTDPGSWVLLLVIVLKVVDWAGFSFFQANTATHTICVYSAFTPQVVRAVWQPPTQELFDAMVERLAQVLPSQPPSASTPWYRSRVALLGALLLSILPLVIGGIVVYQLSMPGVGSTTALRYRSSPSSSDFKLGSFLLNLR
jgi:hypothetical protein